MGPVVREEAIQGVKESKKPSWAPCGPMWAHGAYGAHGAHRAHGAQAGGMRRAAGGGGGRPAAGGEMVDWRMDSLRSMACWEQTIIGL